MKSFVLPSFWKAYQQLNKSTKQSARKSYKKWKDNPFHSSLYFKCINQSENIWSVRINRGYRALGIWDNDAITWFWIGSHDDYEEFFG